MIKINNLYIRIFLNSFIPILIMSIIGTVEALYLNKNPMTIIFFLLYGYILLSIPLLFYGFILDKILSFTENSFFYAIIFSVLYGLFLTFLPMWLGDEDYSVFDPEVYTYIFKIILTGILSVYFIEKMYPKL